jgi:2-polyprenyl-6-methoxyphenol hydroxylase-like FAD-dependent oxidoreductase
MIPVQNNLKLKVLIVGAGLGGLAVGINLSQRGHIVAILEGAPELGEVGAGIQIPPNSVKLLTEMGLYDKVFRIESYAHSSSPHCPLGRPQSCSNVGKMGV